MTCLCFSCNLTLGEKCPRCGEKAVPLKINSNGNAMFGTEFNCPCCGHHFQQGEGGEFHAHCGQCFWFEQFMLETHIQEEGRI